MLGVIELKKETRRRENYLTKERSRTRKSKERSCWKEEIRGWTEGVIKNRWWK